MIVKIGNHWYYPTFMCGPSRGYATREECLKAYGREAYFVLWFWCVPLGVVAILFVLVMLGVVL